MSDDLVMRLRSNPTYDDISDAADLIDSQQDRIAELEAAIYHYVNHVVSYEGTSFIEEMNEPPWVKLINDTWVKQAAAGGKDGST